MVIHISIVRGGITMKIMKYEDNHTRRRSYKTQKAKAKAKWIASKFENLIDKNLDVRVNVIKEILQERYRVNVVEWRPYKAKKWALKVLEKEHEVYFRIRWKYGNMNLITNPSSRVIYQLESHNLHLNECLYVLNLR